jgi:SAM-dependent methyltransferase
MSQEKEYVLGTHDGEISRLGLQHRVWRPRALDAWRRAGFTAGQTLLDIGCGPGYASIDLAEIVGPSGKVISVDRSRRFLDALDASCRTKALTNVTTLEVDLNQSDLPAVSADGAWARWVFAFVKHPHELLSRIARMLKQGGVFVIHEYFDYSTWKLMPRSPELEEFVRVVMQSWRDDGGEPDIALDLPIWLKELGFELKSLNPIIDVVPPSNYVWRWPTAFVHVGLERLVELGYLKSQRAREISEALIERESSPNSLMITPAVLEIIAVRQ